MKLKFTFLLLSSLFCYSAVMAQAVGDYQSNVTTTGAWDVAANWQRYDGMAWMTATVAPSSTDGVITIQAGDSIRLTQATTIDQVQVAAGGILSIFNTITPTTFTLADGPEASDINVDGRLYIANGATLTGAGSVMVNAGGLMVHRNEGVLDVNTTIASMADLYVNREPTISSVLTNNGTMTLLETGDLNFADGTLINNGLFTFLATANVFIRSVSGTNLIQNTSTGIFRKEQATGFIAIAVALQNQGIFEGLGEFSLNNIVSNSGRFSPGGNTVGILEVNEQSITGHTPTVRIQIGNVTPGVGHDQLQVNGTTSLSGVTLSVAGTSDAPTGLYTVMTTTSGAFTGSFAQVDIPANYSLVYTPGTNVVRVQKNFMALPLNWGTFNAVAKNNTVALTWTTLQESNTAVFIIEHSV
ncbi:MAG TPA: hypothetical protein VM843_01935, partial [Flavisolibacter sp.]|nr:hypothetical protein [Flavisolibacter sp.]